MVRDSVPTQLQVSWGQPITIQCPYSPGVFYEEYGFEWNLLIPNRVHPNIDQAGNVQLDKASNSLTIPNFNPLFEGTYECALLANGMSGKDNITVSLEGEFEV